MVWKILKISIPVRHPSVIGRGRKERRVTSKGVMSSQSSNVVTFVWSFVHPNIELETRSKILSLRRGLCNFHKNLSG
jgi:hypothetical protein